MPDADTEASLVRSLYTSPVPGVKKGLQALLGLMRVVSQFSFEAICDMISLHNERARMRERDDDDQKRFIAASGRCGSAGAWMRPTSRSKATGIPSIVRWIRPARPSIAC